MIYISGRSGTPEGQVLLQTSIQEQFNMRDSKTEPLYTSDAKDQ
jgi:hypothetical protein